MEVGVNVIASQSADTLHGSIGMFVGIVIVLAYCFVADNQTSIKFFVVTFLIYYFVILIYDTWYFVKIEKRFKQNV